MTSPLQRVLRALGDDRPGDHHVCPAHDDDVGSLSVAEGDDGRVLIRCHAGCRFEEIVRALGLETSDLFPSGSGGRRGLGEIVARYNYTDESGECLFQVVRFEPKEFRQRRPDGLGGWEWRLGDVERVPYQLPDVTEAAAAGRVVFVAEGEKDADALAELDFAVTTCPGGADAWRDSYSRHLVGSRPVILTDNDQAGRDHARNVAQSLLRAGCEGVRILELPDLPKKGDVSDWLDAGGTAEELKRLVPKLSDS